MSYVYAAMWFLVAIILVFRMGREAKVFYLAGGFFFLLGIWWLMGAIYPDAGLFTGVWGIVLRVVTGLVLLWLCFVFYKSYKKDTAQK